MMQPARAIQDARFPLRVGDELDAERAGEARAGAIVVGGTEPPGRDQHVGGRREAHDGVRDVAGVVADRFDARHGHAAHGERARDRGHVGIGDDSREDLVADQENGGAGHGGIIAAGSRACMPRASSARQCRAYRYRPLIAPQLVASTDVGSGDLDGDVVRAHVPLLEDREHARRQEVNLHLIDALHDVGPRDAGTEVLAVVDGRAEPSRGNRVVRLARDRDLVVIPAGTDRR